MPPRGKNKLKEIQGQPSVLSLVPTVSTTNKTPTPTNTQRQATKDRTPPTPPNPVASESNPNKRINMENTTTEEDLELGELTPELKMIDLLIKRNLKQQLEPINSNINSLLKTAKITEKNALEITTLKKENTYWKQRCQKLELDQKHIKERLDRMENHQLENNLILHGIPETTAWEYPETRYTKVIEHLASTMNGRNEVEQRDIARNLSIQKTKRIGKFNIDRNRPISITFSKYEDVEYLLAYKRYLPNGIYLDREYCEEIERKRKLLRPIMRCAKNHTDYKRKCRMEDDTIIIKGKHYTVNNLHQLPAEINGFEATSRKKDGVTCYFGELNPLSNFHPSKISYEGQIYHSSEQLIQHKKAQLFGDEIAEAQILSTSSALECKLEAKNIRNYDQQTWEDSAKNLCYDGIKLKFAQNPWLRNLLLSTNDDILGEATYDKFWGTGVPIHRNDCTDRTQWHSNGIMGEMLMEIRMELRPSETISLSTTLDPNLDSSMEQSNPSRNDST